MTKTIPESVVERFPKYLALVQALLEDNKQWVSSAEIARALDLTSSTVRQDLSYLDYRGVANRGYEIENLDEALTGVLGLNEGLNVLIVGAGNLGRALTLHGRFQQKGFNIRAVIDSEPALIGEAVGSLVIEGMDILQKVVQSRNIDVGIIAAPPDVAQEITGKLVLAGVRGILNMSGQPVHAPQGVPVVNVRLLASLQQLAYAIKVADNKNDKDGLQRRPD